MRVDRLLVSVSTMAISGKSQIDIKNEHKTCPKIKAFTILHPVTHASPTAALWQITLSLQSNYESQNVCVASTIQFVSTLHNT